MWTGNDQNENINETNYNEQGTERLCVCIYMYTCVSMCVSECVYTCVCLCVSLCMSLCVSLCMCVYTCKYVVYKVIAPSVQSLGSYNFGFLVGELF